MNVKIKQDLAHRNNYGSKRDTKSIKHIVVHYTANDGDSDEGNANYFNQDLKANGKNIASAHYFVDDDSITQSVPDDYIAYHCGGGVIESSRKYDGGSKHSVVTNSNSIGIEMCDDKRDGVYILSNKVKHNVMELIVSKMIEYNIKIENVVRHFDVTGKMCPRYFCEPYGSSVDWGMFKTELNSLYNKTIGGNVEQVESVDKVEAKTDSVVLSPSSNIVEKTVDVNDYKVKVFSVSLNIRKGPSTKYGICGEIKKNEVYTIVEEYDGWGKLKSGAGWIKLSYTTKL